MNEHLDTHTQRTAYQTRIRDLELQTHRLRNELAHVQYTCEIQRSELADKDRELARAHVALREIRDHCRRQDTNPTTDRHCHIDAIAGAVLDTYEDGA